MTTASCTKCGLRMRGRFKSGPPSSCPRCGHSGSAEDIRKAIEVQKVKQEKPERKGWLKSKLSKVASIFK